jgi:hypothetical protein
LCSASVMTLNSFFFPPPVIEKVCKLFNRQLIFYVQMGGRSR